ncbi:VanZ family protein [Calidifontibacillus oryziterrae]|uniref:VanZ family protein n=1 Tax=Calidifontibacillus oryziterrae TaxID=1191699 RepID=UPI000304569F|nr:VanZ family protein [Calidifontibacillus oryziterrae]
MRIACSFWLPTLIWASIIFLFSSQTYEVQSLRPYIRNYVDLATVTELFSNFQFVYAGKRISVHTVGAEVFLEFCIRKGAHFAIFFILGWLLFRALISTFQLRQFRTIALCTLLIILYAASDEVHQMFTVNRTPSIHDVFLDIIGGLFGILLSSIQYRVRTSKIKRAAFL